MTDLVVIAIVAVIIAAALGYIIRAKKRGVKCIGCPAAAHCHSCSQGEKSACECSGKETHPCSCHTAKK